MDTSYKKAVLNALQGVESAAAIFAENQKLLASLERSVSISERTLRLSLELF